MTSKSNGTAPVLKEQIANYLSTALPEIAANMQKKERLLPDEHTFWLTVELRCPRPRGMSRDRLIRILEFHLCQQLQDERGFENVYINGVTDKRTYYLRWTKAVAPASVTA